MHKYCWRVKADLLEADPSSLKCVCEQRLNDESILRSQLDMKTPHHSVSGRSYLASTPDNSNIAVFEVRWISLDKLNKVLIYSIIFGCFWFHKDCVVLFTHQGDWVWLKKGPSGVVSGVNSSTEYVFVKVSECAGISTTDYSLSPQNTKHRLVLVWSHIDTLNLNLKKCSDCFAIKMYLADWYSSCKLHPWHKPDDSQPWCFHCLPISSETWGTRTSICSWDCSSTLGSLVLWPSTAPEAAWRICSTTRMCVLTGCSSLPC